MKRALVTAFFLLFLASFAFSQTSSTTSANLLEKIELRFDLAGNPTPADVGFGDIKSNWKLSYELLLSDEKTVRELQARMYEKCRQNTAGYSKCVSKVNKKLDKKHRKTALFVSRGAFEKSALITESNRVIRVPVNFSPEIIRIFNDAATSPNNPVFILQIKSRISGKTTAKTKIKRKTVIAFQYPLKFYRKDGAFDFYNVTAFGANFSVERDENGRFSYAVFRN